MKRPSRPVAVRDICGSESACAAQLMSQRVVVHDPGGGAPRLAPASTTPHARRVPLRAQLDGEYDIERQHEERQPVLHEDAQHGRGGQRAPRPPRSRDRQDG